MQAPFAVRGTGHNHGQPWHSAPGTRDGDCFLRLIRSGHGWLSDHLGTRDLSPRQCCLVTPEDPGLVRADPQRPYDFLRITYGGNYATFLTRRIVAEQGSRIFPVADFDTCWRLAASIHAACGDCRRLPLQDDRPMPAIAGMLAHLLCLLLPPGDGVEPSGLDAETLRLAIAEAAADPLLSVGSLARRFGVSAPTLTRFCRRTCDISPRRLIETVRCELAQSLLTVAELPVQEVARRVGYDDPFYFSRVFRRLCGVPPSRWRLRSTPSQSPVAPGARET